MTKTAAPPRTLPTSLADPRFLEGPVLSTLLQLSATNAVAIIVQVFNSLFDAVVAGRLGTVPLQSVSFVVPIVLLMHGVAAVGYGGGVSSAVARALGEGDRDKVELVSGNGLLLGIVAGTAWGGLMLIITPALYAWMGASAEVLEVALSYSNIVFAFAPVSWLFYGLLAILRGSGQMAFPAAIVVGGSLWYAGGSLALIFIPGSPIYGSLRGIAIAFVLYHCVAVILILLYIRAGKARTALSARAFTIRRDAMRDVLRVGIASGLNSVQAQLLAVVVVAFLGALDSRAAAGYGIGWRLEQIHVALGFGVGLALVAMVGANVGAGNLERARRIAWTGGLLTALVTGVLGVSMAVFPRGWIRLFTSDETVIAFAIQYLTVVGPTHAFFGLGLALYYASQGAGSVTVPLLAGTLRLTVAALGCWMAGAYGPEGMTRAFVFVAASFVVYGVAIALWCARRAWPPVP